MNDLRYALRTLRKSPGFVSVAVLTLAIGIGATTAMFSVVRGVLLEPLPYDHPDELVSVWTRYLPSSGQDIPAFPLSPPELIDYREQSRLMRDVVPYGVLNRTLAGGPGAAAERVRVGFLGAGMFDLLGVHAAIGRTFAPEEELPDVAPVAVLGHDLWETRFGGDTTIIGRNVIINGEPAQVVGVMGDGFVFPNRSVDLWMPFGLDEATASNRFAHYLLAVGRLAPGATLGQARAELATITDRWKARYEHHAMGHFVFLVNLHDDLVGDRREALWLLMGAAVLVLIIAAVNVANLLLARGEQRQDEIAVRVALGAGRRRLLRQFLAESAILALAGAAIGVLLALWATPALLSVNPQAIPRVDAVRMDGTVLAFALVAAAGTTLLFGLVPAWRAASRSPTGLVGQRTTGTRRRTRLRATLVGAEAGLGVIVVLAAGLLARSFVELASVDPGIRPEGLLLFDLQLPEADYPGDVVPQTYEALLQRLRALPGVTSAGATSTIPVADIPVRQDIRIEGRPEPPGDTAAPSVDLVAVHPGYLETLGFPLRSGRTLEASDRDGTGYVAAINAAAARRYWPGADPLLARVRFSTTSPWITIVGVVGDTKVESLREGDRPQIYLPHHQLATAQGSTGRSLTVALRTHQDPLQLVVPARAAVAQLDPGVPVANLRTMEDVIATAVAPERFSANLFGGFALIALLLAAIGVYGMASYAVARRTRDIGIRMALGAPARSVLTRIVRDGVQPVALGAAVGLLTALAGAGVLQRMVYGVGVRDPLTFAAAPLVLLGVAALATWWPARRATGIDPMEALRHE